MYDGLGGLINEYRDSLKEIRHVKHEVQKREGDKAKSDASLIGSMERDLEWAIEYMTTGYMPAYSVGQYKKIVPVDPQKVLTLFRKPLVSNKPSKNHLYTEQEELLGCLNKNQRDAMLLVIVEGISYGKAGKYLGMKKSNVESLVRRGKQKLRDEFIKRGIVDRHSLELFL